MALGCGAKVLKYSLFGFNLIFVIAGLTCVGVGLWLIIDDEHSGGKLARAFADMKTDTNTTIEDLSRIPPAVRGLGIVLASVGGFTLLIAFLGCCGAVKELRPLLALYAVFLLIILICELGAGIYAAANKETIEHDIKQYTANTLKYYGGNDTDRNSMRVAWDLIMEKHDCCGLHAEWLGERGFNVSKWHEQIHAVCDVQELYPKACCFKEEQNLKSCADDFPYHYCPKEIANKPEKLGCYEKIKSNLQMKMAIIVGVGVAVGLIEIVGVIFSLCLCRAISSDHDQ